MNIKVAVVQMDFNPSAHISSVNYLKEPVKPSFGNSNISISTLSLILSNDANEKLKTFNNKTKNDYIKLLEKKLEEIIKFCSMHKVDLIVFPEYSIPAEILPKIKKNSKEKRINIVAGSHAVLKENYTIYKKIEMIRHDEPLPELKKAISPIFHLDGRVGYIEKFSPTQRMDHDITPGKKWDIIEFTKNNETFIASIFICLDYVNEKLPERTKSKNYFNNHIVIVPSYTPTIKDFEDSAIKDLVRYKRPVIFANCVDAGGSRIFCYFDPKTKEQLSNNSDNSSGSFKIPEGEEGIVMVNLDLNKQHIEKPTSHTQHECSLQEGVYPFVYSNTLKDYELIQNELKEAKDHNGKKEIINKHKFTIYEWAKYSVILMKKFKLLDIDLENLSDVLLNFLLDVFYLNEQITPLDTWRLEKFREIERLIDYLLQYKLDDTERQELKELRGYYSENAKNILESKNIIIRNNIHFEESRLGILIVEDNKTSAKLLSKILKDDGHDVSITESKKETLEYINHNREIIDLIILDLYIPERYGDFPHEENGFEILQHVKNIYPSICVIILTAFEDVDLAVKSIKKGANDFLVKPLKLELLRNWLQRISALTKNERNFN